MESNITQIWQLLQLKKEIQFSDYINVDRLKPICVCLREHLTFQKLSKEDIFQYLNKIIIKTINISGKQMSQVWKLIIYNSIQNINQKFTLANTFSVGSVLNLIGKYIPNAKTILDCEKQHFMKLWKVSVKYSDYRLLHYILLSLYFNLHVFFFNQSTQNIQKKQKKKHIDHYQINKVTLLLISYCEKINQKQIIDLIILTVQKISFHLVTILTKNSKTFVINPTLQNLYLCQFIYMSKLSKITEKQTRRMFNLLAILNEASFFQRLINAKLKQKFIWSFDQILKPRRLQGICFAALVNTLLSLCTLQNSKVETQLKNMISQMIQILVKRELTINIIKFLTKKLQIVNEVCPSKKWAIITKLMSDLLQEYPVSRHSVQFQQKNSYISKKIHNVQFPFSLTLKLKGESLPFKQEKILLQLCQNSKQKKLWITMRNYLKNQIILSFVSVEKNMIYGKEQKQFKWKQYKTNHFSIIIRQKKIKLILNHIQQKALCIDHDFENIQQIVLCDREEGIGSTVSQLFQFNMVRYKIFDQNQEQVINLLQNQNNEGMFGKNKENVKIFNCKVVYQDSFIKLMEGLGDLQLFFLILNHVIRKISDFEQLLCMVRQILSLMNEFVVYKNVSKIQLTKQSKSQRRNSVLCLCWLSANLKKSSYLVLQLMRFINIRGNKQIQQHLKFLCNFAFWKQFTFQQQKTLLFRIRQLLKQAINQEVKPINTMTYCRRLLFQMILFYKDSCLLINDRDDCLKFHKLFLQTIYQHIKDLINFNKKKNKFFMVEVFKFLKFLIKLIACTLNQKLGLDIFDITFAIQLTQFLKLLAKLFFDYKQKKLITFSEIDAGLQEFLISEDKGYIPLSINQFQSQQERFNIFLTFMISQSKGLINQFQVETVYLQQSKTKIYPIYQEQSIFCSQDKVKYNLLSFNIYLHMLTEKSWNYLLFLMPIKQYNEDLLQMIWKICFIYHIQFQELKKQKIIKMIECTPLPKSQVYLFKIFSLFLEKDFFCNQNGYNLFKAINKQKFKKQIINILKTNYQKTFEFDKQNENQCSQDNMCLYESTEKRKVNPIVKIYQTLYYVDTIKFEDCFQLIESIKQTKSYSYYKLIIYHIVLRSLVQLTKKHLQSSSNINKSSIQSKSKNQQTKVLKMYPQSMINYQASIKQQETELQESLQPQNSDSSDKINLQIINEAITFYLKSLNVKCLKEHLNIQLQDQALIYLQNYQINIQGITNAIAQSKQPNFQSVYFEKYIGFIQIHLINFSKYLILKKFNFEIQSPNSKQAEELILIKNKRNKFMYKTVVFDLTKSATLFFIQQSIQRRKEIFQIQKIWLQIQHKNRFFWSIFINSEKYYNLSQITSPLGERLILEVSNKRPKLKLPTMGKSQSGLYSISLLSEKYGQDQTEQSESTFFQQNTLFKTEQDASQQCYDEIKNIQSKTAIKSKANKSTFKVYLITNQKIYQGIIEFISPNQIYFTQNQFVSQLLYDRIIANAHQRRSMEDVQKNPKSFTIQLNQASRLIYKKYLFFDIGLEIVSSQKTCLFCFQTSKRRQIFCSNLKEYKENVLTYPKIQSYIQKQSKRWSQGFISNFQYLMKINQLASRSINDLSQYFVMPWTIAQFETQNITKQYLMNKQNFRDLSKPIGKVFKKKWNELLQRYKMNFQVYQKQKQSGTLQPFLFGSFYSNPAIVANYLIRLNPYSTFHYLLQSKKFDHADRLFFSFAEQYNSCRNNSSDMKELIPQFYNNPQFLINRSNLNLGNRQNSDLVHDVKLPKWAKSPYQFIFKMRMFIQSPIVTLSIHKWIDLIFGKYSKHQNSLKADNLFLSQIYGPNQEQLNKRKKKFGSSKKRQSDKQQKVKDLYKNSNSNLTQFESKIYYYKQFGQIPKCLFNNQHIHYSLVPTIQKFNGVLQQVVSCKKDNQKNQENDYSFQINENLVIVSNFKQVYLFEIQDKQENQKIIWKQVSSLCSNQILSYVHLSNIKEINSNNNQNILLYIKDNKKLCCRQIKRSRFLKTLQIKEEQQLYDCHIYKQISKNVFVLAQRTFLKIIRINCEMAQFPKKKKMICGKQSWFCEYPVFTQHKYKIIKMEVNQQLNLIFSVDESNKIFILKYSLKQVTILNSFQIKSIHFNQKIKQVLIHPLSLIIILTTYHRLLVFNYLGDLIFAKQITFKNNIRFLQQAEGIKNQMIQIPQQIGIFNKQSSQLVLTTNYGNIWKIDLFEFFKKEFIQEKDIWMEKIQNKQKQKSTIKKMAFERSGRHWKIYFLCQQIKSSKKIILIKLLKSRLQKNKN